MSLFGKQQLVWSFEFIFSLIYLLFFFLLISVIRCSPQLCSYYLSTQKNITVVRALEVITDHDFHLHTSPVASHHPENKIQILYPDLQDLAVIWPLVTPLAWLLPFLTRLNLPLTLWHFCSFLKPTFLLQDLDTCYFSLEWSSPGYLWGSLPVSSVCSHTCSSKAFPGCPASLTQQLLPLLSCFIPYLAYPQPPIALTSKQYVFVLHVPTTPVRLINICQMNGQICTHSSLLLWLFQLWQSWRL